MVESDTGPASTSSMPTRLSSASLRCPHASQPSARALASASTASWAGVGHGPFVAEPAARHRYHVGLGMPSWSQNATTVIPTARRSVSSSSKPGREPPFAPQAKLHVRFAQGGGELFVLGGELLFAAGRSGRAAGGYRLLAAVEELVTPVRDRGLRDALAAGGLRDRQLAAQDGEHDPDLVLRRSRRGSCHRFSLSSGPTLACLRNLDTGQG